MQPSPSGSLPELEAPARTDQAQGMDHRAERNLVGGSVHLLLSLDDLRQSPGSQALERAVSDSSIYFRGGLFLPGKSFHLFIDFSKRIFLQSLRSLWRYAQDTLLSLQCNTDRRDTTKEGGGCV